MKNITLVFGLFVALSSCAKLAHTTKSVINKKQTNQGQKITSNSRATTVIVAKPDSLINNPALRIRTKSREFVLGYRTAVTIVTTSGNKVKSNILDVKSSSLILAKGKQEIAFNDIKTIRVMPTRRIWKWISFPTIVYPIYWSSLRKGLHANTRKCKKQIQEFKLVNKYQEFKYGRDNCQ